MEENACLNRMSVTNVEKKATIAEILGRPFQTAAVSAGSYATSYAAQSYQSFTDTGTGSYFLEVLFYFLAYGFVIFMVLLLVHYSVTPIFQFNPGDKGYIKLPGTGDDKVYWTNKSQPSSLTRDETVPLDTDALVNYPFDNNFTISVDLYIQKLNNTPAEKRLIFYKAKKGMRGDKLPISGTLIDSIKSIVSLAVYLDSENNLVVNVFTNGTEKPSRPIQNIPLGVPFRLTVTVEPTVFTVYINGKQAHQRFVKEGIVNSSGTYGGITTEDSREVFHSMPDGFTNPRMAYVQNLHVWPSVLSYSEIVAAQPALAREEDFALPPDVDAGTCN